MDKRIEDFRAAVDAHRASGAFRYPKDLREEAAELVPLMRRRGDSQSAVEEQLGVRWQTLSRWSGATRTKDTSTSTKPIPVVLEAVDRTGSRATPVITTPNRSSGRAVGG